MSIFLEATRKKLRFPIRGSILVEDLWDVKYSILVEYEEDLIKSLEKNPSSTRRKSVAKSNEQKLEELRLAIVTEILNIMDTEQALSQERAEAKQHNAMLDEIIARKQQAKLENMSVEELMALRK